MTTIKKIILATHNYNKVKELQNLLTLDEFKILHQKVTFETAEKYEMPEEPFYTFVENALHKARSISKLSQNPTIADDSGLCIPQLNNLPGVKSARFYEEKMCDNFLLQQGLNRNQIAKQLSKREIDLLNNQFLAKLLPEQGLKAYYVANLVYVQHENDPNPLVVQGLWHGIIKPTFNGNEGFGYDPMFYPCINGEYQEQSVAQIPLNIKNKYSHRAVAFKNLLFQLQVML